MINSKSANPNETVPALYNQTNDVGSKRENSFYKPKTHKNKEQLGSMCKLP